MPLLRTPHLNITLLEHRSQEIFLLAKSGFPFNQIFLQASKSRKTNIIKWEKGADHHQAPSTDPYVDSAAEFKSLCAAKLMLNCLLNCVVRESQWTAALQMREQQARNETSR